jgi:tripartite-type tricarboxylate transporter receptor subunit TctC
MIQLGKAAILVAVILLSAVPFPAGAEYPDRPIQVLCGWPVGSKNDMTSRAIGQGMEKILKQPFVIQNVPGGGGALVLGKVKITEPDGYTLFQTGSPQYSRIPHLRKVPYDPLKDFAYLGQHGWFQYMIEVRGDSPWKTYEDLIDYVKKNPNKVRYATTGVGVSQHIMMEYITKRENLKWVHVPFTGGTECTSALLGGHIEVSVISLGPELEHIKTGRLRALLSLIPKRCTLLPDVPSVMEKGYDFAVYSSGCWSVPAKTPKDIQKKLEGAFLQAMKDPTVLRGLEPWMWDIEPLDGKALTQLIFKDYEYNGKFLKEMGLGLYAK